MPERGWQIEHADEEKEHQSKQGVDKRSNFLTVRPVAAASNAHPQNTPSTGAPAYTTGHVLDKLRTAEMLRRERSERTAMKIGPSVMSLSHARAAPISFRNVNAPAAR